jgi:hypothetical protein
MSPAFDNMYKLADPESPLRSFNKVMTGIATMKDCVLLPPKIELMVEDNDFNRLKYYLKFKTGKLTIEQLSGKGKEFDVAGWVFVFSIFIGIYSLSKFSFGIAEQTYFRYEAD